MPTHEQEELADTLQKASLQILEKGSLEGLDLNSLKQKFEDYECWEPLIEMLQLAIKNSPSHQKENYSKLLHIFRFRQKNDQKLIEISCELIKQLDLSFKRFQLEYLSSLIIEGNGVFEEFILDNIWRSFNSNHDKVRCLERLCLLCAKVLHKDLKLIKNYESILQLDPSNVLALRYKISTLRSEKKWQEAVELLSAIIKKTDKEAACSFTFELAAIYLLELDEPQKAIDLLSPYKDQALLDPSEILYEAFYRLKDWQQCLSLLHLCLDHADDRRQQAILCYKLAWIYYLKEDIEESKKFLDKSFHFDREFLDTIELQTKIAVETKDYKEARKCLESLMAQSKDKTNTQELLKLQQSFDVIIDSES